MAIYFGTTEITKLRDLAPQTGLDITDLWFGSTNVYTVWGTYEGTLPATLNANGDDMRQYQLYGNTGVGDRTENLFDMSFYKDISGITVSRTKVTGTCDRFFNVRLSIPADLYEKELTWSVYIKRPDSPGTARVQTIDGGTYKYGNNITGAGRSTVSFTATSTIRLYINYGGTGTDTIELSDIMLTEGSTTPASFVPYGFKLDMVSRTRNLFDESTLVKGFYTVIGGEIAIFPDSKDSTVYRSFRQSFAPGTYTISFKNNVFLARVIVDGVMSENVGENISSYTVTTQTGDIGFSMRRTTSSEMPWDNNPTMLNEGSTALPYQPYSNTVTPVYIGDDPLEKDEYVDYGEQKIYRMIDGTLTPTDSPVPLPALPTVEGTTIVDYAGSGTAPEKVLLKYRKEGF